jgi:hypothetical protein
VLAPPAKTPESWRRRLFAESLLARQTCLTLPVGMAENIAALSFPVGLDRGSMLAKLARSTGVVLLATCVAAAPVWATVPRCLKTGAIAGGGNCCCGPKRTSDATPGCCHERPCCAESQAEPEPQTASSNCCCQRLSLAAAMVDGTDRLKLRDLEASYSTPHEANVLPVVASGSAAGPASRASPLKLPLEQVYCRWTV